MTMRVIRAKQAKNLMNCILTLQVQLMVDTYSRILFLSSLRKMALLRHWLHWRPREIHEERPF
jgi:DNA-binding transcriptional regulator/RsmH inhibitor MraZ